MTEKKKLVDYKELESTPFTIVESYHDELDKNLYYVMFGKYQIADAFESEEEAKEWGLEMSYNRIVQLIMVVLEEQKGIVEFMNNVKTVSDDK